MSVTRIDQNSRMSQASKAGQLVILAGQVSSGKTIKDQAKGIFQSIDALLEKAGTDKSNILYANIFLTDMGNYEAFNQEWDKWVSSENGQAPSRAAIQVVALASPDWLVEVQVFVAI